MRLLGGGHSPTIPSNSRSDIYVRSACHFPLIAQRLPSATPEQDSETSLVNSSQNMESLLTDLVRNIKSKVLVFLNCKIPYQILTPIKLLMSILPETLMFLGILTNHGTPDSRPRRLVILNNGCSLYSFRHTGESIGIMKAHRFYLLNSLFCYEFVMTFALSAEQSDPNYLVHPTLPKM